MIRSGEVVVDEATYTAKVGGRSLDLTFKEFELLKFLAQHPGRVFSRQQLLPEVWGYDYFGGTRTVDVHVRRLRAKLGAENETLIGTVRNVGYRFVLPGQGDAPTSRPATRSEPPTPYAVDQRGRRSTALVAEVVVGAAAAADGAAPLDEATWLALRDPSRHAVDLTTTADGFVLVLDGVAEPGRAARRPAAAGRRVAAEQALAGTTAADRLVARQPPGARPRWRRGTASTGCATCG